MSIADHERDNLNSSAGFIGPGLNDLDSLGMVLFKEILGDYNANQDGMAHVNSPDR